MSIGGNICVVLRAKRANIGDAAILHKWTGG